jgi:hypothetical protein
LAELSKAVDAIGAQRLLDSPGLTKLSMAIHRQHSLWEDKNRPRSGPEDPGWQLRRCISKNSDSLVILDAHNILYQLKELFGRDYENGYPGKAAREHLIRLVANLAHDRPKIQVRIYFDGPKVHMERVIPNVRIEFSGGTGPHRADHRIHEHLTFADFASTPTKKFVVSNDMEVRRFAQDHNALPVSAEALGVILTDAKQSSSDSQ